MGWRWAVVVSSLGFGLFHAPNPGFGPLPFVNLVLFGVATALYKVRVDDGQLWGVFGIHTVWNWLQQVVFGLPNSGVASVPRQRPVHVTPDQRRWPDLVTGGGFGPEGTLAASLVLLALIGVHAAPPPQSSTTRWLRLQTRRGSNSSLRRRARDAAGEQQPVNRALVGRQHLVWCARRQAHTFGGYHTRAISTERLQELQSLGLCTVPQHAGCHQTTSEFLTVRSLLPGRLPGVTKRNLRAIPRKRLRQ